MPHLAPKSRISRVTLTDQYAQLMKGRPVILPGYNAEAMVSAVAQSSGNGMSSTAADGMNTPTDSGQLVPMLDQAEKMIGEQVLVTLAFSTEQLLCLLMGERLQPRKSSHFRLMCL